MSAPPNVLVLLGVHARDAALPRGRARGAVTALSMTLGQGIHAVLGAPDDGTLALLDVVTGHGRPLRGKVTIDGRDPARTPAVRARIGVLAAEPRLPPASSVGAAVRLALRARGEDGHRIDAVLDPLGLSALHARRPSSLSFGEQRAVELALALTTPAPLLLALHEPLSDVAVPNLHLVHERLREIAAARACVLITTSSPADARTLGDRIHVLHKGFLVREVSGDGRGLLFGAAAELTAFLAPSGDSAAAARALAAALSRGEGVRGVAWEEAPSGAKVRVQGDSAEACAAALTDAAVETGVTIDAIVKTSPDIAEVRASTDTLLRMHLAAARGQGPRPAPFAAPVAARAAVPGAAPVAVPAPAPEAVIPDLEVARPAPAPAPEEPEPPRSVPILPGPPDSPEPPATPVNEGER